MSNDQRDTDTDELAPDSEPDTLAETPASKACAHDPLPPPDVTVADVLAAFTAFKEDVRELLAEHHRKADARMDRLVAAVDRLIEARQEHVGTMVTLGRGLRHAGAELLAAVEPGPSSGSNGHAQDAD